MNAALAACALAALGSLIIEHGFRAPPAILTGLHKFDFACVALFASFQVAKLAFVPHRLDYLRSHRVDFSLLFVLAVQTVVHLGLRTTPEFRYLRENALPSPLWAFYVGTLQAYLVLIVILRSNLLHRFLIRMRLHPAQVLLASFLLLVTAGAGLLLLPGALRQGPSLPVIDALFTATSAVCVTGLVVCDVGERFSALGQTVLLGLIQAGGLGMLTITGALAVFTGRRLERDEAATLAHATNAESDTGMRRTLGRAIVATLSIEALGALALFCFWEHTLADPMQRAGWAVFHSVSAFCNAGFSLTSGNASLAAFSRDPALLGVIGGLILLGGFGYGVLEQLGAVIRARFLRRPRRLGRHARWVLALSATLVAGGAAAMIVLEAEGILAPLDARTRWITALFHSVSMRTAGFSTVDLSAIGLPLTSVAIALMLLGGAPGGPAGGMKTTTAAAAVGGLIGWPKVSPAAGRRALRLVGAFLAAYVATAALLAACQGEWSRALAFEAASALATVGLTMGSTSELTPLGKLVLCGAMFVGRVGPFAIAAGLLRPAERAATSQDAEAIQLG